MKVDIYVERELKREVVGTCDSYEDAEKFLFDYASKSGYESKDLTEQKLNDTHKRFEASDVTFGYIRHIEVVAAIIIEKGKLFATQRGYGEFKDGWEFPGGKMEAGETMQQALERELREELAIKTKVTDLIKTVEYDYPGFHLTMHCLKTEIVEGVPNLLEHEAAKWVDKTEIDDVAWLPADQEIVDIVKEML